MDDLPPPIKLTPNSPVNSPPDDDPLFEAKINNPFSKFFKWIKDFIKRNQNITIKIPIIGIFVALSSFSIGLGSGYNWGVNAAASTLFPDSSPVFHRPISVDGVVVKSSSGKFYLKSKESYVWILKPVNSAVNLADYVNKQVTVKGNLTREKSVIEVSEIILLNAPMVPTSQAVPNDAIFSSSSIPSNPSDLPSLYSGLTWETNQKKVLIFTSGKRKIEQEGIYLEAAQVSAFPQDFINYYIEKLKAQEFKETLNSINPEGIMITYAKDDLFLTFGIKNIYKGSGEQKQLSGYKAFIEHN